MPRLPNDGVAAIEQNAGDTFLIRAEPRGGCDVLVAGLFRTFPHVGTEAASFYPLAGTEIEGR